MSQDLSIKKIISQDMGCESNPCLRFLSADYIISSELQILVNGLECNFHNQEKRVRVRTMTNV